MAEIKMSIPVQVNLPSIVLVWHGDEQAIVGAYVDDVLKDGMVIDISSLDKILTMLGIPYSQVNIDEAEDRRRNEILPERLEDLKTVP